MCAPEEDGVPDGLPEPTQAVKRKAEAAGIDLDALRRSEPTTYAVLNAQRAVRVSPQLKEAVGRALFTAFPEHQLFDLPQAASGLLSLLIFPPLGAAEMERLDEALATLAPQLPFKHAFYRVVTDSTGERRELALPVSPTEWRGQANVMIGPFEREADAQAWGDAHVPASSTLVSDVLLFNEEWFCDLFLGNAL